ncbi:restriction endonuclease subunit S [Synechococcus sp. CS-1326]|uniref:restriction endonuclease subunit S n=1 Tax=Synechococcus sp. CS-1326 TaxID=2847978 RepID=UPI00223B0296|nr:restriction endonuclease subunit S [Synechococcus sp. CS-1326]MCT0211995.1 restriction endonuclease subunit S [Synechococcus sp. CS-1326]
MISDLKPYPKMKDTGLPWVDQVPSHWKLVPNRALLSKRKVLVGDRHTGYRLLSLTKAGVIVRDISSGRGKFSADMGTSQEVREGDLVFCLFDVPETPRTVGLSKHHGMITGAYTVFECKDNQLARFLEAFYIAMDDRKLLSPLYSGLRNTIPPPVLLGQKTPLPPVPEQAAIVRFLDHADRKMRRYIRAKQKLIKLLEEQKQAIIHRAVTRGLDPNVPLKPSGVEWLGDVPEHWKVAKLGRFIELTTGFPFRSDGFTQDAEDIRLLRGVNISPGKIRWTDVVRWPLSEGDKFSAFDLQVGDIVLGMDRPIIQRGTRIARVNEPDVPALLLQRVARIRPLRELHGDYLSLLLAGKSFADYLTPIFTGVSVPHLSPEQIKSLRFTLPPSDEQSQIVRWAAEHTKKTTAAITIAENEIILLREYRTRLIADVVTGKLDVREAAALLLDEDQELPTIDELDDISEPEEDDLDDLDEGTEDPES